ncbi:MAG: aminopeptidase P N-terminal domain-containing protein [Acidobacteriota bacterium]
MTRAFEPLPAFHAERRRRFLEALPGGAAIFGATPVHLRNGDVHHPYRPDSDLFYLTGFEEPEAVAVLRPGAREPYVLFVRAKDPVMEAWDGARAGPEGAKAIFGADEAFPVGDLPRKLPELLAECENVHVSLGKDPALDGLLIDVIVKARKPRQKEGKGPANLLDPSPFLHEMRLRKSPEELDALRRAVGISAAAHRRAMEMARPGVFEYEVQAVIEETFRRLGAARVGYGTIVASGPNATVLHYVDNSRRIEEGDLVLIDAGAEYECYTGDITRTFPASGAFTAPQRHVYDVVLAAQQAAIREARPGNPHEAIHEAARTTLVQGLLDLGALQGSLEEHLGKEDYKKFFLHRTSHWLGMDVHDAGAYKVAGASRPLEPGMVLTVEPGLYFPVGVDGVPPELAGIGVRIEDDVLISPAGPVVLSDGVPTGADEMCRVETPRAAEPRAASLVS